MIGQEIIAILQTITIKGYVQVMSVNHTDTTYEDLCKAGILRKTVRQHDTIYTLSEDGDMLLLTRLGAHG